MKKVIAVMPAYNESRFIGEVIKNTRKYVDELVVVDDCSRDDTYRIAKKSGAFAIRLVANMGAGFTTRVGCDIALRRRAGIIVTIDADGQHDPSEIPKLVSALRKTKLDIVFGSRPKNKNMPFVKKIGNFGLSTIANMLYGINIRDSQTGFHVFTKDAYNRLRWTSTRFGIVSEFVMRTAKNNLKFREVEVKTIYNDKEAGMNKLDALKSVVSMFYWRLKEW